jgi:hypothetical protein
VQDAFEKEAVLGHLMQPLSDAQLRPRIPQIAAQRDIPEDHVRSYVTDLYKLSLPADHGGCKSFCARMAVMIMQVHVCHLLRWWSARRSGLSGTNMFVCLTGNLCF